MTCLQKQLQMRPSKACCILQAAAARQAPPTPARAALPASCQGTQGQSPAADSSRPGTGTPGGAPAELDSSLAPGASPDVTSVLGDIQALMESMEQQVALFAV